MSKRKQPPPVKPNARLTLMRTLAEAEGAFVATGWLRPSAKMRDEVELFWLEQLQKDIAAYKASAYFPVAVCVEVKQL